MSKRLRFSLCATILQIVILSALAIGVLSGVVEARQRRHTHREHKPTPMETPSGLKAMVFIAGGTGSIDRPTGESPGVLASAEIYDVAGHRFLPINAMSGPRDQYAAAAVGSGKVLILGGVNTLLVPVALFPGPSMPWILRSAEVFDSSDGKFQPAPTMKYSRDQPTATTLESGKVLIVGGDSHAAELYDPLSNTFVESGSMASSRHGQSATLLRTGDVMIAGGGSTEIEVYEPINGSFHPAGKLRDNRVYHTSTPLVDGRVLIAGGCYYLRSSAVDSTEIFDPASRTVRPGPKMMENRAGHTATLLRDGRVLIAGGGATNSSEFYDPASVKFKAGPKMTETRSGQSATLLPDGTVLIAGGWDPNYNALASAEIFDPSINKFVAAGNMSEARAGHRAILVWARQPIDWIPAGPSPTLTTSTSPRTTSIPTESRRAPASPTPTAAVSPVTAATPTQKGGSH